MVQKWLSLKKVFPGFYDLCHQVPSSGCSVLQVLQALRAKNSLWLILWLCWQRLLRWRLFRRRFWHGSASGWSHWQAENFLFSVVFLLHWSSLSFLSLCFRFWFFDSFRHLASLSRAFRILLCAFWRSSRSLWARLDVPTLWTWPDHPLAVSSSRVLFVDRNKREGRLTTGSDWNEEWWGTWWIHLTICWRRCRTDRRNTEKNRLRARGCSRLPYDRLEENHFGFQRVGRGTVARRSRRRTIIIDFGLCWLWARRCRRRSVGSRAACDFCQEGDASIENVVGWFEDVVVLVGRWRFGSLRRRAACRNSIAKRAPLEKRKKKNYLGENLWQKLSRTLSYFGCLSLLGIDNCCEKSEQSTWWRMRCLDRSF